MRDEIEHLLDDNEDLADLYSTRKWIQNQQSDSLVGAAASGSITPATPRLPRVGSNRSASMVADSVLDDDGVEDSSLFLTGVHLFLDVIIYFILDCIDLACLSFYRQFCLHKRRK